MRGALGSIIRPLSSLLIATLLCFGAEAQSVTANDAPKSVVSAASGEGSDDSAPADLAIANALAAMLQSGRTVISNSQTTINDPALGDKGLDGKTVLAKTIAVYKQATGNDPTQVDPHSRLGRLQRAQMDAIVEVMDANQAMLNTQGTGFKGFIPAVFARLVNEAFGRRAAGEAQMKVTAPVDFVRNRRALPDAWETEVINDKFLKTDWPRGKAFAGNSELDGHPVLRLAVPEYYSASCLSCHGQPKGTMDITGYPREGGAEGDLGAVISVVLMH